MRLKEEMEASKSWFGLDDKVRQSVNSQRYLEQIENQLLSIPLRFVDRSLTEAEYKGLEQGTHPQMKTAMSSLLRLREMHVKLEKQKKRLVPRIRHFFNTA